MIKLTVVAAISVLIYWLSKMTDTKYMLENIPQGVKKWLPVVRQAADLAEVPAPALLAILWVESDGDADAIGSAGEVGLMQLKPIAVRDVEQFYIVNTNNWDIDSDVNILVGAYFLKLQLRRTKGDLREAIRAYNQGYAGKDRYPQRADEYYMKVKERMNLIS